MLLLPIGDTGARTTIAAASSSRPIFVYTDEKKIQRQPGCMIEIYLVDREGRRHLAAIADDTSGDMKTSILVHNEVVL